MLLAFTDIQNYHTQHFGQEKVCPATSLQVASQSALFLCATEIFTSTLYLLLATYESNCFRFFLCQNWHLSI